MRASLHLGRVAGVPVGVNWSVLVIFALIAWGLSAGRFPDAYPGHSSWAYAAAGTGSAVVFFLGLLAHEVSHAVLAVRNGLAVRSITLWLFGGVAQLEGEAESPGAELRIAGVGPLVSLVIGLVFGGAAAAVGFTAGTGLAFGTLAWLAGINVALAVFNAAPAAPLDGGRLLRAALWKWRGDRVWAAVVSARVGRGFGALLIGFGLWQFLLTGAAGMLWLALIGWFLLTSAAMEERQAQVGGALAGVTVRDVMTPDPQTVPADISVAQFLDDYLLAHRHSAYPLVDHDEPVGLVNLSRVRDVPARQRAWTTVREIACLGDDVPRAAPDDELLAVLRRLDGRCTGGRILVVRDNRLAGLVSPSDISRALLRWEARDHRDGDGARRQPPGTAGAPYSDR